MSEIVVPNLIGFLNRLEFKYPEAKFKYYYIDIDDIPRNNNDSLFIIHSAARHLFHNLNKDLPAFSETEAIFIYFSNLERRDYNIIFNRMCTVLDYYNSYDNRVNILLVVDNKIFTPSEISEIASDFVDIDLFDL